MDIKHLTLIKPFTMTQELYLTLTGWLQRRGMPDETLENLPNKGRIIYYQGKPIAIGFIRDVEGGFAMIDGFLADPDTDNKVRSECLDYLTLELLNFAKSMKINKIFALTLNNRTIKRAKKLGFHRHSHVFLTKSI